MGAPALVKEGLSWREVRLRALHTAPVSLGPVPREAEAVGVDASREPRAEPVDARRRAGRDQPLGLALERRQVLGRWRRRARRWPRRAASAAARSARRAATRAGSRPRRPMPSNTTSRTGRAHSSLPQSLTCVVGQRARVLAGAERDAARSRSPAVSAYAHIAGLVANTPPSTSVVGADADRLEVGRRRRRWRARRRPSRGRRRGAGRRRGGARGRRRSAGSRGLASASRAVPRWRRSEVTSPSES